MTTEDAALARELAGRADIMIENFRPGGLTRWGLDYDSVAAANPEVIYASISGFGTTEKGAALPGYDLIVQAISGLMSLTGDPDGPPYRAGISVFDVMAGLHAVIGILVGPAPPPRAAGSVSTSRSTCSPRPCPDWSTTRARTWPAAWCRTGWATATRACSRTSRCRARTAT